VHPLETPWLAVELLAALRRGEIVALQADRPYGDRAARVVLFGGATDIPAGPWDLAAASGAPILPAVALFEGAKSYRLVCGEPVFAEKESGEARGGSRDRRGIERLAAAMEALIAKRPDQWFNFYDVWPDDPAAPSTSEERERAPARAPVAERRRA
jgi:KDO2-lipid IV(A) lauroyltransferase